MNYYKNFKKYKTLKIFFDENINLISDANDRSKVEKEIKILGNMFESSLQSIMMYYEHKQILQNKINFLEKLQAPILKKKTILRNIEMFKIFALNEKMQKTLGRDVIVTQN